MKQIETRVKTQRLSDCGVIVAVREVYRIRCADGVFAIRYPNREWEELSEEAARFRWYDALSPDYL